MPVAEAERRTFQVDVVVRDFPVMPSGGAFTSPMVAVSRVPGLHRSHVSAALKADYFGLKNIKPDKLPPASLGIVFEVPQSSLQIDQACVSRAGAVRANSSADIRDSCASRKSSDVYGFRPEYHTCVGFLILVTLAPWTHAWPRRHHYKCVRFAGSAQRHKELCPWRKRQPYLRKKNTPQQACRAATAAAAAAAQQSEATAGTKVAAAAADRRHKCEA